MIEVRSSNDDTAWEIEGENPYDVPYDVDDGDGPFAETLVPGLFNESLRNGKWPVELRVEHEQSGAPLASTVERSRTLRVSDKPQGLAIWARLQKDNPIAQAAVSNIRVGILDRLSVAFSGARSTWNAARTARTVHSATLREVSLVHMPANAGAKITSVRSEQADPDRLEVRTFGAVTFVESRGDYTDAEQATLGNQGHAVWLDGHWAFPVKTKADFDAAVLAVGRTPGPNRVKVRRFLIQLAKDNGWAFPPTWNANGTTTGRSAELVPRDAEFLFELRRLAGPGMTFTRRPARPRYPDLDRFEAEVRRLARR
jgi:HK97 family phage prohead protease